MNLINGNGIRFFIGASVDLEQYYIKIFSLKSRIRVRDGRGNPTLLGVDCNEQPDRVYEKCCISLKGSKRGHAQKKIRIEADLIVIY